MWSNTYNRVAAVWLVLIIGQLFYLQEKLNAPILELIQLAAIIIATPLTLSYLAGFLLYKKAIIMPIYRVLSWIIAVLLIMSVIGTSTGSGTIYFWKWDAVEFGILVTAQIVIVVPILIYGALHQKMRKSQNAKNNSVSQIF